MSTKLPLDAGQFDRRIKIWDLVETQDPNTGAIDRQYVSVHELWAHIKPLTGRELAAANQVIAASTLRVFVRWLPGITERHEVEIDGDRYDVIHIAEYGRKDGLEIMVKKPSPQTLAP